MNLAQALQQRLDEVVGAHRDAARGDQDVGVDERLLDQRPKLLRVVGRDPQQAHLGAGLGKSAEQREAVGVDDLARTRLIPDLDQLVAGRHQGHPRKAPDRERGEAHRGGKAQLGGPERTAGPQGDLAALQVGARLMEVGAPGHPGPDADEVAVEVGVLHHHDRVGAFRQHPAGQDPGRRARLQRAGEGMAGGRLPEDPEP